MSETNPLQEIKDRAASLKLEGEEYDDYVESRMKRLGFKKGPGEWISLDDDDDDDRDDDNEPMTRGDYRRIQRDSKRKSIQSPPKKEATPEDDEKDSKGKKTRSNPWWD